MNAIVYDLKRKWRHDDCVMGELSVEVVSPELNDREYLYHSVDGIKNCDHNKTLKFLAYTLEPKLPEEYGHGMKKPACIQEGVYELAYVWSPKFRGYRWMLKDVPFFSGILIHVGNFPKDTLGCILVGDEKCSHSIGVSKKADERLRRSMNRIKETGCKQYIRITNEFV